MDIYFCGYCTPEYMIKKINDEDIKNSDIYYVGDSLVIDDVFMNSLKERDIIINDFSQKKYWLANSVRGITHYKTHIPNFGELVLINKHDVVYENDFRYQTIFHNADIIVTYGLTSPEVIKKISEKFDGLKSPNKKWYDFDGFSTTITDSKTETKKIGECFLKHHKEFSYSLENFAKALTIISKHFPDSQIKSDSDNLFYFDGTDRKTLLDKTGEEGLKILEGLGVSFPHPKGHLYIKSKTYILTKDDDEYDN